MASTEENVFLTQGNELGVDPHLHASSTSDLLAATSGDAVGNDGLSGVHDHVSQSTRLHHKMREMKEMDDALALMKSDYADRIRNVKDGESKFLIKQHNIIKYLRRFKLFILESDTKRARAEKKEAEEHRQRLLKIKEIEALRAQFLHLQQTRSDLKQKNDHYKQNKSYLESVKDAVPEQYAEIDELIVRHQILKQTNLDLTEANRVVNEKMETISQDLQQLLKSSQNSILVKNSRFASLLQKLEQVTNSTSGVESEVQSSEHKTKDMNRYFCEVQMAIQNIYARTMSSLPSQKAVSQMKKRLKAQNQASAAAAGQNGTGGQNAANASASNPDGSDDEDSNTGYAAPSSAGASSRGGIGSANSVSFASGTALDLTDSEDEDGGGEHGDASQSQQQSNSNNPQSSSSQQQATTAEEALARQQLIAHNRQAALKQHQVKSQLLSRLDAIAERLEDLQDIVEYIHPGALQMLREGGSIYSQQNHHGIFGLGGAIASSGGGGSGGAQGQAATNRSSRRPAGFIGSGGGGGGSGGGHSNPSAAASHRPEHSDSSSRRSHKNPSSSSQQHPGQSQRGSDTSQQSTRRTTRTEEPEFQSTQQARHAAEYKGEARQIQERQFREINATLAQQMSGLLGGVKSVIPAHQTYVPGTKLPVVKGTVKSTRATPRSSEASPRSPNRRV